MKFVGAPRDERGDVLEVRNAVAPIAGPAHWMSNVTEQPADLAAAKRSLACRTCLTPARLGVPRDLDAVMAIQRVDLSW